MTPLSQKPAVSPASSPAASDLPLASTIGLPKNKQVKKPVSKAASRRVVKSQVKARPAHGTVLRLFVAGATTRSHQAILRLRTLCDEHASERFVLEVIDIYQSPDLAQAWQIVATPTLIREHPAPERRFIGDMSDLSGVFTDAV